MATGVLIRDAQGNIQRVPFEQLQAQNPDLYSKYIDKVAQPEAGLTQTQTSTAHTAAEIPTAQAQAAAATTSIPLDNAAPAVPATSQDAIQNIKSIYQKSWQDAKNITQRSAIASDFKSATGTDLFNLYLPSGDIPTISNTLATKQQIDYIKQGLTADPNLKHVIGNPLNNVLVQAAQNMPGGPAILQKFLGLNDKGMAALSGFLKLQGGGDRQLVGGRLSGYMINYFGAAQPGIGRSYSDNINQLNNMSTNIDRDLNLYAKNNGFQSWQDVPGLAAYQTPAAPQTPYTVRKVGQ